MSPAASALPAGLELIATLRQAVAAVEALFADARRAVAERVTVDGRPVPRTLDREQRAAHGLAWLATYVEADPATRRSMRSGSSRPTALGEIEELLVRIGAGEYLAQILGGIPMSQGEIVRLVRSRPRRRRRGRARDPAGRAPHRLRQYGGRAARGSPR